MAPALKLFRDQHRQAFAERLHNAWASTERPDYGKYSELARHFGITPSAVKRWFDGETIPTSRIARLAAFLDVRAEWLLNETGPMREVEAVSPGGAPIPVQVNRVSMRTPDCFSGHPPTASKETDDVLIIGRLPEGSFAYRVGDSTLFPEALSGMVAIVAPIAETLPLTSTSRPVVVLVNGAFLAGRYIIHGDPTIEPINRDYKPVKLSTDHKVLGEIVAFAQRDI